MKKAVLAGKIRIEESKRQREAAAASGGPFTNNNAGIQTFGNGTTDVATENSEKI